MLHSGSLLKSLLKSLPNTLSIDERFTSYRRWLLICDSSALCLLMFFLGACVTLGFDQLPPVQWLLLIVAGFALLSLRWRVLRPLVSLLIGFAWACYSFQSFLNISFPEAYERVDFVAGGVVEGLPISNDGNIKFNFRVSSVSESGLSNIIGQRIQLSCYRCPLSIRPGEVWQFTLRVKRPHGYASWGSFDYEKYLFRHQVIAKGYIRLKANNSRTLSAPHSIDLWRQSFLDELHEIIGHGVGSNIIAALTIGVKSGFSNQQQQVFQTTGVSHLMAISGLHVGLVFVGVTFLLRWLLWPVARIFEYLPRQQIALLPALCAATFYAALAGFSVSTQRALIMLLVYVLCKLVAREATLIKVLLIAVFVLLIIDPFSLLDVGFWLSCGAVAVIALVSGNQVSGNQVSGNQVSGSHTPDDDQKVADESVKKLGLLRLQPLLWLGMLPFSVLFFAKVSLLSPLVNLIAVPLFCALLIPATLFSVLLYSLGFNYIGAWCLIQLNSLFDFVFQFLQFASQLNFAKIYSTPMIWWQWGLFVLLLIGFLRPNRGRYIAAFLLVVSVFTNTASSLADDELRVTLLDVGQGLAMVIETPNTVSVYDTGPRYGTGFTAAEAVLLPFLRQRGIRYIDTLVISHADNDHIGGLNKVREAFAVGQTISSRLDKVSGATECFAGQSWQHDHTSFQVISPQADTPQGSNNRSCVIMLQHFATKILLTGDIEKQVERFLLKTSNELLKADILLVPHQGSKTSSTAQFIEAVAPTMAMLAAGYKNHYGHPHPAVVERYQSSGIDLLSTIEHGSVLLKINSHGWTKVLYRQQYRRFWHYQKMPNRSA
ncbi:MAG: competence protein ComEC [Arenicella sp.]